MYRLALRFLGHPQDAEDATQEILIRIVAHWATRRPLEVHDLGLHRGLRRNLFRAKRGANEAATVQIETSDNKLDGLFRALLNGQGSTPGKHPVANVGIQPVPVVEVDAMPADQPKRRRRPAKAALQPEPALREEKPSRAEHRRSTRRQLALVPQRQAQTGSAGKPRQTACSTDTLPRQESLMALSS